MRLSYTYLEEAFASNELDESDELTLGAIKVLAQGLGVAEKSIHYLLQNGWSQSIQDAFAAWRAIVLQPNIDETQSWTQDSVAQSERELALVSLRAAMQAGSQKPDLLIWPELRRRFIITMMWDSGRWLRGWRGPRAPDSCWALWLIPIVARR